MSLLDPAIEGTLKPDGSLQLDSMPNVPPGRVQVIVQPLSGAAAVKRGILEVMDEVRANQQSRGFQLRSQDEADAEDKLRQDEDADYDKRFDELLGGSSSPSSPTP